MIAAKRPMLVVYLTFSSLACLLGSRNLLLASSDIKPQHHLHQTEPRFPAQFTRLTLKSGSIVGDKFSSLTVGPRGPTVLTDVALVEELAHMNRERIPERVVHARGQAAFGKFNVTSSLITKYCKASVFSKLGKRTPVVARFSLAAAESGSPDSLRDVRGFAVKFYTEAGNWDSVGINVPVFSVRDSINFASFVHTQKRNPRTHLRDPDAFWEFVALRPETLGAFIAVFSDFGIPDGFRHMSGWSVNTFKLVNADGEPFYARFHWHPDQGTKNLPAEAALKLAGEDPDRFARDLLESIERGEYPSWTLKFQVLTMDEVERAEFDVLDVTRMWPLDTYPLYEIGRMTLDKNPTNYFAQVEQLAFSPANLVPGIEASPDRMLASRMFAYPDAQRYRLGANYFDIPVNQPRCPAMTPTYVDGLTFKRDFGNGTVPNYVPSSKFSNMVLRDTEFVEHAQRFTGNLGRFSAERSDEVDNYAQAREFYLALSKEERKRLAKNIATSIKNVTEKSIFQKAMDQWRNVDENLANDIAEALESMM